MSPRDLARLCLALGLSGSALLGGCYRSGFVNFAPPAPLPGVEAGWADATTLDAAHDDRQVANDAGALEDARPLDRTISCDAMWADATTLDAAHDDRQVANDAGALEDTRQLDCTFSCDARLADATTLDGAHDDRQVANDAGALEDARQLDRTFSCDASWTAPPFDAAGLSAPTAGLVAHWSFDEPSGSTAHDESGRGHDGVLVNMEPEDRVTGVRGTALAFSYDDYVEYSCAGCPAYPYAVSLWFRSDALHGALLSYYLGNSLDGVHKTIAATGQYLHVGTSHLRRGVPLSCFWPGRWYHLAVNYPDANSLSVYVDGIDLTVESDDYWNAGSTTMGRRFNYSALQYEGQLDEVRLYDRLLTVDEIRTLHALRR